MADRASTLTERLNSLGDLVNYPLGKLVNKIKKRDYAFGFAIHFENEMTLGLSFRHNDSEDAGLFISYDLLKGVQDKKETIDKYRNFKIKIDGVTGE